MVLLQIQQLHKKQGDFQLSDISLDVAAHEVLAILGESGSGKTSLLQLIAGLVKPDQGQIVLGKKILANAQTWVKPQDRPIGLSFQDAWLFPKMTVAENIQVGMKGMSKPEKKSKTGEWLRLLGLAGFGDRYPHELSGGEQQRIALARALATQPQLMLFDEPFSKLDAARRSRLRADVARLLKHTKTAAIIVTHDVEDVYALADRVAILEGGELVQQGTPEEVYLQPKDAYAARLFGPANIVSGERLRDMGFDKVEESAWYCIRPEQISLLPVATTTVDAYRITAQVFYGNSYQIKLTGTNGEWIVNCAEKQDDKGRFGLTISLSGLSPFAKTPNSYQSENK